MVQYLVSSTTLTHRKGVSILLCCSYNPSNMHTPGPDVRKKLSRYNRFDNRSRPKYYIQAKKLNRLEMNMSVKTTHPA